MSRIHREGWTIYILVSEKIQPNQEERTWHGYDVRFGGLWLILIILSALLAILIFYSGYYQ